MVTEEVRRAKMLRDSDGRGRPWFLPLRVRCPLNTLLNYDLDGYLGRTQQREWNSSEDTDKILTELLELLAEGGRAGWGAESDLPTKIRAPIPSKRPVPIAEPELPEGQVDLQSQFYVERHPIERDCYSAISKPGGLIRIKAPRQMGKTSLLARVLFHAKTRGHRTAALSFQLADAEVFNSLEAFCGWLCSATAWKLGIKDDFRRFSSLSGSIIRCTAFFDSILAGIDSPLVLGLDEVDLVFERKEIAANIFGMLRAWHEDAKSNERWKKLSLVLVHSTEVYIPLNINQSPFNVGLAVALPEFASDHVRDLARRHGLEWGAADELELMERLGGHPYLVRVALYELARSKCRLTDILEDAATDSGLFADHLRRHLWNLKFHPSLSVALSRVVRSEQPLVLKSDEAFKLDSMGLVRRAGNRVTIRCSFTDSTFEITLRITQDDEHRPGAHPCFGRRG